jgi:hypothetical protein
MYAHRHRYQQREPETDPLAESYNIARAGRTHLEPDWEKVKADEARRTILRARRRTQRPQPPAVKRPEQSERTRRALEAWQSRQPLKLPKGEELAALYPDYRADLEQHRKENKRRYSRAASVRPGAPRLGEG